MDGIQFVVIMIIVILGFLGIALLIKEAIYELRCSNVEHKINSYENNIKIKACGCEYLKGRARDYITKECDIHRESVSITKKTDTNTNPLKNNKFDYETVNTNTHLDREPPLRDTNYHIGRSGIKYRIKD